MDEGAAHERWAFAFSAMSDWKPKLESDIEKIAKTGRGYTKAFFVTNQAVKASQRAKLEDELGKKHGPEVRVLDRTWILDRVFGGHHADIAVEELKVTALPSQTVQLGPQDAANQAVLLEVEARIKSALAANQTDPALVDDALDAADRMRRLERPSEELEAAYARADRLAMRFGSRRQRAEVAYQLAHTRYFWLEDFEGYSTQYDVVEARAEGSPNLYDFERLFSLWSSLWPLTHSGSVSEEAAQLERRTAQLRTNLERFATDEDRPSVALDAETMLIKMRLLNNMFTGASVDAELVAFGNIIERSQGLVGYPFQMLVEVLTEIGSTFEGRSAWDELFEKIVAISSAREGELKTANLLLTRGQKQLALNKVATLGRVLVPLYKEETRDELVLALGLIGMAYAAADLMWAARGSFLAGLSLATDYFRRNERVTRPQWALAVRLKWLELGLGRISHVLAWHNLSLYLRAALHAYGEIELSDQGEIQFEHALAGLLLKTDFHDLSGLETLPDTLDALHLDLAGDTLLFALGHESRINELAAHLKLPPQELASQYHWFACESLGGVKPDLYEGQQVHLSTCVLGCRVEVVSDNQQRCVAVTESLLALTEALLATGGLHRLIGRVETVRVRVRAASLTTFPFSVREGKGAASLDVWCGDFDAYDLTTEQLHAMKLALDDTGIKLFEAIVYVPHLESLLEKLFGDERARERALNFTGSFAFVANSLGRAPEFELRDWIKPGTARHQNVRKHGWTPNAMPPTEGLSQKAPDDASSKQMPTIDPESLPHSAMRSHSLVHLELWDQAGWSAAGFAWTDRPGEPPFLALVFKDRVAGRRIFEEWRSSLGIADAARRLRISIVRGVDRRAPLAYRVVVGVNIEPDDARQRPALITMVSRHCEMQPKAPGNLEGFLESYQASGRYTLIPAFSENPSKNTPEFDWELGLNLEQLNVVDAWRVGPHDLECTAIHDDDEVVIPEDVTDPPVEDLFRRRKAICRNE